MKKGRLQTAQPEPFHPSFLGETPGIAHATVPGDDNRTGLGFKPKQFFQHTLYHEL